MKKRKFTVYIYKRENDSFEVEADDFESAQIIADEECPSGFEVEMIDEKKP